MRESWSTRWYTPLLVLGAALLALMVVALAVVEVLVASAEPPATPTTWMTRLTPIEYRTPSPGGAQP